MEKGKEVTVGQGQDVEVRGASSPVEMVQILLEKGIKPEDLEKMLTLQERYEATQARKAYNDSMVNVHKHIKSVAKTLKNPQTHSNYASLDNIVCATKAVYTEEGFSISFYEGDTDKPEHVRVCADVIHRLGHKETYHYDVPMDGKGLKGNSNMTAIHAKASSVSYARRYLMCMIWNIPTGDDDGNAAGQAGQAVEYIDEGQLSQIVDYINDESKGINKGGFLKYMGIESADKMPKKDFPKAMAVFKKREEQKGEK